MEYKKYEFNGRILINMDTIGLVDYDKYLLLMDKIAKKKEKITNQFIKKQNINKLDSEPDINFSYLYEDFLEMLEKDNPKIHSEKIQLVKNYVKKIYEIEAILLEEKRNLLNDGYPFDDDVKKFGYYIFKDGNNYYQLYNQNIYPINEKDYNIIKNRVKNIHLKVPTNQKQKTKNVSK